MTARTIVCSECGEAVPYGRLSCPACGALLASVAGGSRPPGATADQAPQGFDDAPLLRDDEPLGLAPTSVSQSGPRKDAPAIGGYLPPGAVVPPLTPRVAPPIPAVLTAVAPAPPAARASVAPVAAAAIPGAPASSPWWAIDGLDVGLDRAIAIGAGLVAAGLLLPWSGVVIGSPDLTGYFGTWGLAGPGHILVLVVAVGTALLAAMPNRVPAWLRSGVAGLALGTFVIALLWPYVVGPLGASLGSLVDLVGALVLVVAGVVAIWRARHAPGERAV